MDREAMVSYLKNVLNRLNETSNINNECIENIRIGMFEIRSKINSNTVTKVVEVEDNGKIERIFKKIYNILLIIAYLSFPLYCTVFFKAGNINNILLFLKTFIPGAILFTSGPFVIAKLITRHFEKNNKKVVPDMDLINKYERQLNELTEKKSNYQSLQTKINDAIKEVDNYLKMIDQNDISYEEQACLDSIQSIVDDFKLVLTPASKSEYY